MRISKSYCGLLALLITMISCNPNDPIEDELDNKAIGVFAGEYLSGDRFDKLVIEILHHPGFAPQEETIDSLKSLLNEILNKPKGIQVVWTEVASPSLDSYTLNEIKVMESNNRTRFTEGSTLSVSAFFADADYAGNSQGASTLGIAYANTSFVVFEKTIKEMTDQPIVEPDLVLMERTVVNHEFGHLLGLVNIGTPQQNIHEDEANSGHCDNEDCLMYFAAETGSIANRLFGSTSPPTFDQNCLNDLKANGGK